MLVALLALFATAPAALALPVFDAGALERGAVSPLRLAERSAADSNAAASLIAYFPKISSPSKGSVWRAGESLTVSWCVRPPPPLLLCVRACGGGLAGLLRREKGRASLSARGTCARPPARVRRPLRSADASEGPGQTRRQSRWNECRGAARARAIGCVGAVRDAHGAPRSSWRTLLAPGVSASSLAERGNTRQSYTPRRAARRAGPHRVSSNHGVLTFPLPSTQELDETRLSGFAASQVRCSLPWIPRRL